MALHLNQEPSKDPVEGTLRSASNEIGAGHLRTKLNMSISPLPDGMAVVIRTEEDDDPSTIRARFLKRNVTEKKHEVSL